MCVKCGKQVSNHAGTRDGKIESKICAARGCHFKRFVGRAAPLDQGVSGFTRLFAGCFLSGVRLLLAIALSTRNTRSGMFRGFVI